LATKAIVERAVRARALQLLEYVDSRLHLPLARPFAYLTAGRPQEVEFQMPLERQVHSRAQASMEYQLQERLKHHLRYEQRPTEMDQHLL
jgi:hypothetical protein